jgi:fatty-acyl-CoA synthase
VTAPSLLRRASSSTVASLFAARARVHPNRIAIEDGARSISYRDLDRRSARLSHVLGSNGISRGSRIAVLSENRAEVLELFLAAARIGAIVACESPRLAPRELAHCIDLVEPACVLASSRHAERVADRYQPPTGLVFGDEYERAIDRAIERPIDDAVDPEDALFILYTSGTTGLPKGAVISQRAEIARNLAMRAEMGLQPGDATVAWPPLHHMGAIEWSLGTLMCGGKVIVVDGYDRARLADIVARERVGWLLLMPGMVGSFAKELRERGVKPAGVRVCGVMADLVPPKEIAEITTLLGAPYANTFGATETGCPPCSSNVVPIGVAPTRLSKVQSPFCEVRLVDDRDRDVADGTPGELCMRGPTLFSGYFRDDAANARDFRGGWFHMGDVFVRNADGTLDFVDRVKYLVKTGGESVYPAEIERVIVQDARVAEVAVVRRRDDRWGEVPVAFVARRDDALTAEEIFARCRTELAKFKQPKEIHFLPLDAFPRSASGKVQRHELEKLLAHEKDRGDDDR